MTEQHVGQIIKDVVGTSSYFVDPNHHHPELTHEAASLLGAHPLEVKWTIEEDGICSTSDDQRRHHAVSAGDEWRLERDQRWRMRAGKRRTSGSKAGTGTRTKNIGQAASERSEGEATGEGRSSDGGRHRPVGKQHIESVTRMAVAESLTRKLRKYLKT